MVVKTFTPLGKNLAWRIEKKDEGGGKDTPSVAHILMATLLRFLSAVRILIWIVRGLA
jgi:hypothetical protein